MAGGTVVHRALLAGLLLGVAPACMVFTGPALEQVVAQPVQGLLRLGDVNTSFTGTWAAAAPSVAGFDSQMGRALHEGPSSVLFTGDPGGLTLDIDLVVDHADDTPRLTNLGLMSILTLGVVPLWFASEWAVQCTARIKTGEGREVGRYSAHETGTYKILALPPTMFTLLGAGIRGDNDYKMVERKVTASLAKKLYTVISADYARLARLQQSNVPTLDALGGGSRALLERGRLHLAAGRVERAREDLMQYAESDPRLFGALDATNVLEFYDVEGRRARTVQAAARARRAEEQGDPVLAFQSYQSAYALATADDEVERFAADLVRLYPRLSAKPPLPEVARRFFIAGQERAKAQQYSEAAASFARVTRVAPWFPKGHFNHALVLEHQERFGEAAASMQRFLDLAPDSQQARVARDRLYQWQGRVPAAMP